MPKTQEEPQKRPAWEIKRADDFISRYANNVLVESTAWDVKLICGQVDLQDNSLTRHTAITISWPQIKILSYLLKVHVMGHEADFGRIKLPEDAVMDIPEKIPLGVKATEEMWSKIRKEYQHFIAENPEVAPRQK